MRLAGLLIIRDGSRRRWQTARRELKRVGPLGLLDVIAFRACARLVHASDDARWEGAAIEELRRRYPARPDDVPRLTVPSPNSSEAREFLQRLQPDLVVARCKVLLRKDIFQIPRAGTFVLHPGICPEYRNAHGCFWALANRDLSRVGMTLLRVDEGIDTGPVYLHGTCEYDERRDSHIVIQQRAVVENLDAVARTLIAVARGEDARPVSTAGRQSATWGQPRLTSYLRWKLATRRAAAVAPRPFIGLHDEARR
jgi:methionyl-tRNA formyltransferase